MTTTTLGDDAARQAAEELALQCWDLINDPQHADKDQLRHSAVQALFTSRTLSTRNRVVTAARTLALFVIAWVDNGGQDAYRKVVRASHDVEKLRIQT